METKSIIKNAFLDAGTCAQYYNRLNGSFRESGVELIHHIRTIYVVNTCRKLRDYYGLSMQQLYCDLLDLFSVPSQLRLSELVDLSSYKTFIASVETIEASQHALTKSNQ